MSILNNINTLISSYATDKEGNPLKRSKTVIVNDEEKLHHLLKTDYSQAVEQFKDNHRIYRGVRNYQGPYFVKIPGIRKSQNTQNSYTRLFSGLLPSWDMYPPRNKSFICTTELSRTRGYISENDFTRGQYIILPKNNAKIGICSFMDIWDSFISLYEDYGLYTLENINYMIYDFIETVSLENKNIPHHSGDIIAMFLYDSDETIKSYFKMLAKHTEKNIDKIIKKVEEEDKEHRVSRFTKTIIRDMNELKNIKDPYNLLTMLDRILDPERNKFRLTTINNFKLTEEENKRGREVWTDSPCLFINIHQVSLLNKNKERDLPHDDR